LEGDWPYTNDNLVHVVSEDTRIDFYPDEEDCAQNEFVVPVVPTPTPYTPDESAAEKITCGVLFSLTLFGLFVF
jgi:hypothetical protein